MEVKEYILQKEYPRGPKDSEDSIFTYVAEINKYMNQSGEREDPNIVENHPEFWRHLKSGVNHFMKGWRPLSDLSFNKYGHKSVNIWCEYPGGGEARKCDIKHLDGSYIFCEVQFLHGGIKQSAIAWHPEIDYKGSPYRNENQRSMWRNFYDISSCRTIKYNE